MKKLKNENGVITMITLLTVLFIITFLLSSYIIVANKVKTQKEIINETKKIYKPKYSMEEIYNSYFSNDNVIPIYTVEQLLAIGSGEQFNIDGKIYTFSNNEDTAYFLKNNLEFTLENDWMPIYRDTNFLGKLDCNGHILKITTLNGDKINYNGYLENIETTNRQVEIYNNEKNNLYDLKIYGNSVKQTVRLPQGYQEVEWIGTDGNSWFISDFNINNLDKFTIYYRYNTNGSDSNYMWGATNYPNSGSRFLHRYANLMMNDVSNNVTGLGIPVSSSWESIAIVANNIDNNITCYNNGAVYNTYSWYNNKDFDNFGMFCNNYNRSPKSYKARSGSKIAEYRVVNDENGEEVFNLIPCYRTSDDAIGMYDLVSNVFYTNEGTGTFTKGAIVPAVKNVGDLITDANDTNYGKYKIPIKMINGNFLDLNEEELIVKFRNTISENGYNPETFLQDDVTVDGKNCCQISNIGVVHGTNLFDGFEENQQYTFSINIKQRSDTQKGLIICIKYTDGGSQDSVSAEESTEWQTLKITSDEGRTISSIYFSYHNGVGTYIDKDGICLVKGNGESYGDEKYEPAKTTNIYLDEPLRKVGNYVDYIDFQNKTVVRNVEVVDETGALTINESYKGLQSPTISSIELPTIQLNEGVNTLMVNTEIVPSGIFVSHILETL